MDQTGRKQGDAWTFLTHHARVLGIIARSPDSRLRDIAARIGITEQTVFRIVTELQQAGYIERTRHGRRNHYTLVPGRHLHHPGQGTIPVQTLLDLLSHVPDHGQATAPARDAPDN